MKFSLVDCDAIGFDVDHTLCKYRVDAQIELGYQALAHYLVKNKGYSIEILKPVNDDAWMCYAGGLIFDVEFGHFLKLDKDGTIIRASYGMDYLSDAEILKYYEDRKWKHFCRLQEGVSSVPGVFHFYDNNFDITGIVLLSRMIEYSKQKPDIYKPSSENSKRHSGKGVWNDCISAVDQAWRPSAFEDGTSTYFSAVKKCPEKYLIPCSDQVKSWLDKLKESGKTLFIITTSHCDYASHVLDYCFGENWKDYFDLFISTAGKPKFFTHTAPFLEVDHRTMTVGNATTQLKRGEWYSEGNAKQLIPALREFTRMENPKVVYFGDSLRSDIIPSDMHFGWKAIYVMEALGVQGNEVKKRNLENAEDKLSNLDGIQAEVQDLLLSETWGPIMSRSSDNTSTYFADVVKRHSCLAISSLDVMAEKPLDYDYEMVSKSNNLSGFYPDVPSILFK